MIRFIHVFEVTRASWELRGAMTLAASRLPDVVDEADLNVAWGSTKVLLPASELIGARAYLEGTGVSLGRPGEASVCRTLDEMRFHPRFVVVAARYLPVFWWAMNGLRSKSGVRVRRSGHFALKGAFGRSALCLM